MDITLTKETIVNRKSQIASTRRGVNPLLWLAVLLYVGAVSFLHSVRISHFMNGFDLAFYQQAVWNTGQGRFLAVSGTDFSSSLLGTDLILIYALMTPFYMLVPSTLTLLVLETVVVAAGAFPVYWLARDRLGSDWAGLGMALVYLLLPAVQNGNLYELRERMMGGAFLLFAFYWWYRGRLGLFVLASVLALCCRPENGLVLIMLGAYGFLVGRQRDGWRYVVGPVVLGGSWLAVALVVIGRFANGSYALGSTFAGGSPLTAVTTLFTNPGLGWQQLFPDGDILLTKLLYIPLLLLPFGFLPLLSPKVLLLALPSVGLNLLAGPNRGLQWNPFDYHYQAAVIPWLLVATIFAIARLKERPPARLDGRFKRVGPILVGLVLGLTLLVNVGTNLLSVSQLRIAGVQGVKNGWARILQSKTESRWQAGRDLLTRLPDDAPLAITNLWSSEVKPRVGLWYLADRPLYSRHPTQDAQYVFADVHIPNSEESGLVKTLQASGQWETVGQQGDYLLLRRK